MAKLRDSEKGASTVTAEAIDRRRFLSMALGGAATVWAGCGDDGLSSLDTGTSGGPDGTTGPGSSESGNTPPADDSSGSGSDASSSEDGSGTDESSGGEPVACEPMGRVIAFDPESIGEDAEAFPMSLMAGEMRPTSVMISTWIPDALPKLLRVWTPTDNEGEVLLVFEGEVTPNAEGYVKTTVADLCPGTWYRYGVFAGSERAFTGRSRLCEVRTAIADDALEPITLAVACCTGGDGGTYAWPALDTLSDEYYDIFVHLGDMAYNDGMFSIEEYRASWRAFLGAEGYKQAYSRAGLYACWDDHEVDDNGNFDRETMDPEQLQKRQNAQDAYFELLPIDATGPDYQLWRSFRWGLTLEIIVLDCRYERRPSLGQYISPEQMAFLQLRLLQSPCQFKVVMNSVPITNMPGVWDFAANDRWEGYPASRDALLQMIDEHDIHNVWFLSGDFHVCFVSRLEPSGDNRSARAREIAVTSGNTNLLGGFLTAPQFEFGSADPHALLVTFDPKSNEVFVRFIDPATGEDAYAVTLTDD